MKATLALAAPVPPPTLPAQTPRRAADVLVDLLAEAGVEVVFGLPGGVISPVFDALLDSPIQTVTTRHENGALFAAAGYAHTTGKLGVAIVTSGPGALNALTGLASAWSDGLPVLLLAGEVPRPAQGKGVLQDGSSLGLNLLTMARPVSKLALEVPRAEQLPHLVRRAIAAALAGRRGPVVLSLPMDVTTAPIATPRLAGEVQESAILPGAVIDEVAELLSRAERPLILAGSGLRDRRAPFPGSPALLRAVAERLACPVATTPKAKGVFPEDHPLALGVFGLGGHHSARAYLEDGIDVLLALGTSLGDLATDGFSPLLKPSRALVHIDLDGRQLGRSYAPTHGLVAEAGRFLAELELRLIAVAPPERPTFDNGVVRHTLPSSPRRDRMAPQDAIEELQAILPSETIFTVDSGEHFLFATHFLKLTHPDAFVVMSGLGAMGQSLGAALGAALGNPGRPVAALVGDGCFAMNAFEIATAASLALPLRIFVFNDGGLVMVENGHEAVYGRRPRYQTGPLDIGRIATGLGAASFVAAQPGDLAARVDLLRTHHGPVVADLCIDPAIRLPKKDRMGAFAPPRPTT